MPILKPIDETFVCVSNPTTPDDILNYVLGVFNGIAYVETDNNGAYLQNIAYNEFFAVNRLLFFGPVASGANNRYSGMTYDCLLTIARPSDPRQEVETIDVPGQFDEITKEFLTLDFINAFKSYFSCCGQSIANPRIKPVWNVNTYVPAINYSGVEITFTLTI